MHCCRSTFMDYLYLTRKAFNSDVLYPFSKFFKKDGYKNMGLHPYGVYEKGLDQKSSYMREKMFYQTIGKEARANQKLQYLNIQNLRDR